MCGFHSVQAGGGGQSTLSTGNSAHSIQKNNSQARSVLLDTTGCMHCRLFVLVYGMSRDEMAPCMPGDCFSRDITDACI